MADTKVLGESRSRVGGRGHGGSGERKESLADGLSWVVGLGLFELVDFVAAGLLGPDYESLWDGVTWLCMFLSILDPSSLSADWPTKPAKRASRRRHRLS